MYSQNELSRERAPFSTLFGQHTFLLPFNRWFRAEGTNRGAAQASPSTATVPKVAFTVPAPCRKTISWLNRWKEGAAIVPSRFQDCLCSRALALKQGR